MNIEILHKNNGTIVRYMAVLFVCIQHGFMLGGVPDPFNRYGYISIGHVGVLMFFSLSGYLLAGKITTEPLGLFVFNRIFRIFPVLILSDLIIIVVGAFYSKYEISNYFNSDAFGILYRNIISYSQGSIQGVEIGPIEKGNLNQLLNIPQWSLFYEMRAYIFLVILAALGVVFDRRMFNIFLLMVVAFFSETGSIFHWGDKRAYEVTLIFFFGIYLRLENVRLKFLPSVAALCLSYIFVRLESRGAYFQIFVMFFICYASVSFSFGNFFVNKWFQKFPDLTYGIFLLHWPIALVLTDFGIQAAVGISIYSFVLAAVISYPIHILLEEPARVFPRRFYKKRLIQI